MTGLSRTIVCAFLADKSSPVQDYLDSLDDADYVKFHNLFMMLAHSGVLSNPEKFHPKVHTIRCESQDASTEFHVCEFKVHSGQGKRIMACLDGREWVLTHGFSKGGKVSTEGEKAGRIFCKDRQVRLDALKSKGGASGIH